MDLSKMLIFWLLTLAFSPEYSAKPFGLNLKPPEIPGLGLGHGPGTDNGANKPLFGNLPIPNSDTLHNVIDPGVAAIKPIVGLEKPAMSDFLSILPEPTVPDVNTLVGNLPIPNSDTLHNVVDPGVAAIKPILDFERPKMPDILSNLPEPTVPDVNKLMGQASSLVPSPDILKNALEPIPIPTHAGNPLAQANDEGTPSNFLDGLASGPKKFMPTSLLGNSGDNQGGFNLMSLSPLAIQDLLKSMASAAVAAGNASAQLTGIISSVSDGAKAIGSQVNMLHNLTEELGREVSKPLAAIQPFVDAQVHLATTITGAVEGLIKDIQQMVHNLLNLQFLVFILIGITGSSSLLGIITIILLCSHRRTVSQSMRNRKRIEEGYVGKPSPMNTTFKPEFGEFEDHTMKTRF